MDATAVSNHLTIPVNNFPVSHTGKAEVVLLPRMGYPLQLASDAPNDLSFNVELNGTVSFNPTLGDSLEVTREAGPPVLRVRRALPHQFKASLAPSLPKMRTREAILADVGLSTSGRASDVARSIIAEIELSVSDGDTFSRLGKYNSALNEFQRASCRRPKKLRCQTSGF